MLNRPKEAALNSVSEAKGDPGRVSLIAQGNITLIGNNLNLDNLLISTFADINGLNGGDISLKANSINLRNAYLESGSERGNGGNISLLGDSSVLVLDNSSLLSGSNAGKSGNINIQSSGDILVKQSLLLSGVGDRRDTLNAIGGDINLDGRSIFVMNGSEITARASREAVRQLPGGTSGNISVNASKEVIISGKNIYPFPENTRPVRTVYSALLTGNGPTANGTGGNITINAPKVQISNGGSLRAESQSAFSGGNIRVNAQTIDINSGGKILISALGNGNAGNTILNATKRISISGSNSDISDTFKLVTQYEGKEEANIKFGIDNPASGVFASTSKNSTGRGGDLAIATRNLIVDNGATISVSSEGLGAAGNMDIKSRISFLNRASITANTRNSNTNQEQATINLSSEALILRRSSSITTNASGEKVIGGNINISSGVIAAFENSDISANSTDFRGGKVKINTQGIFGTQPRNFLTSQSDITATGASPDLIGTTEITQPDVDPTKVLIELPTQVVDASSQISQLCPRGQLAFRRPLSKFIVTGRGSLPPSPLKPLPGKLGFRQLASLDRSSTFPTSNSKFQIPSSPIIEAQGIIKAADGTIMLVAQAPQPTPSSRATASLCPTSK